MKYNIYLKRIITGLISVSIIYLFIVIASLSSARIYELIAYQIVKPKTFVDVRALPLPYGEYIARWLMTLKSKDEVRQLFLYDVFVFPKFLDQEGQENGYKISDDAVKESFSIASLLIDIGANVNLKDQYGCNSLQLAVEEKNFKVIKFLLDHDANPHLFDKTSKRKFCTISAAELLNNINGS